MTCNLVKELSLHFGAIPEIPQDLQLWIQNFTLGVQLHNQICHISNGIGIESYANDHPRNGKSPFVHCLDGNVSEAYSCQRLQRPIERYSIER